MKKNVNTTEKYQEWAVALGLLVMFAMAVMPLLDINQEWMRWTYAAGAGIVLLARLTQRYNGNNLRIRRLYIMNIVAAAMFCTSAFLTLYYPGTTDWIAFLLSGALLQVYAGYMIDKEKANEAKNRKNG